MSARPADLAAALEALPAHLSEMPIEAACPQWPELIETAAGALPGSSELAAELRAIAVSMRAEPALLESMFELLTLLACRVGRMEALFAAIFRETTGDDGLRPHHLAGLGIEVAQQTDGAIHDELLKDRYAGARGRKLEQQAVNP
jgi:hypothetical protein